MPQLWAIADLHLSLSTPNKSMEIFGPEWKNYIQQMGSQWRAVVQKEDLVLLPGDISWAMKLDQMQEDFDWLEALPGKKVLIRGNHDYWWSSLTKMERAFPPSVSIIHQNALFWEGIAIAGTRLWDSPEVTFEGISDYIAKPKMKSELAEEARIYERELERLKRSLEAMDPNAKKRVVMTHYPPIDPMGRPTRASVLFKKYQVDTVVFGHLHKLKAGIKLYDETLDGIHYILVSADYIQFKPKLIYST